MALSDMDGPQRAGYVWIHCAVLWRVLLESEVPGYLIELTPAPESESRRKNDVAAALHVDFDCFPLRANTRYRFGPI